MKKLLTLVLVLSMAAVCLGASAEARLLDMKVAKAAADGEKGVIELTLWYCLGGSGSEAVQNLVTAFNRAQSKYHMTAEFAGSYNDALLKYINSPAQDRPDVIHINEVGTAKIMDAADYYPVQQFIDNGTLNTAGYIDSILNCYRYNGEMYAWPFSITVPCIVYNADALRNAGCTPEELATYEGFKAACQKIVESGEAKSGCGIVNDSWILEQMVAMLGSGMVDNENGRAGRATQLISDQNGTLEKVLAAIQDFNTSPYSFQSTEGSSAAIIRQAVASKDTAMIVGTAGYFAVVKTLVDGAFNLAAHPMFTLSEDSGNCYPSGAALWITDKGDAGAKALGVVEFIKFFMLEEQQIAFSQVSGYLPISSEVMENKAYMDFIAANYPGYDLIIEHVIQSKFPGSALFGSLNDMRSIVSSEFSLLSNNETTPADAAESIASQTNELIELYNLSNR